MALLLEWAVRVSKYGDAQQRQKESAAALRGMEEHEEAENDQRQPANPAQSAASDAALRAWVDHLGQMYAGPSTGMVSGGMDDLKCPKTSFFAVIAVDVRQALHSGHRGADVVSMLPPGAPRASLVSIASRLPSLLRSRSRAGQADDHRPASFLHVACQARSGAGATAGVCIENGRVAALAEGFGADGGGWNMLQVTAWTATPALVSRPLEGVGCAGDDGQAGSYGVELVLRLELLKRCVASLCGVHHVDALRSGDDAPDGRRFSAGMQSQPAEKAGEEPVSVSYNSYGGVEHEKGRTALSWHPAFHFAVRELFGAAPAAFGARMEAVSMHVIRLMGDAPEVFGDGAVEVCDALRGVAAAVMRTLLSRVVLARTIVERAKVLCLPVMTAVIEGGCLLERVFLGDVTDPEPHWVHMGARARLLRSAHNMNIIMAACSFMLAMGVEEGQWNLQPVDLIFLPGAAPQPSFERARERDDVTFFQARNVRAIVCLWGRKAEFGSSNVIAVAVASPTSATGRRVAGPSIAARLQMAFMRSMLNGVMDKSYHIAQIGYLDSVSEESVKRCSERVGSIWWQLVENVCATRRCLRDVMHRIVMFSVVDRLGGVGFGPVRSGLGFEGVHNGQAHTLSAEAMSLIWERLLFFRAGAAFDSSSRSVAWMRTRVESGLRFVWMVLSSAPPADAPLYPCTVRRMGDNGLEQHTFAGPWSCPPFNVDFAKGDRRSQAASYMPSPLSALWWAWVRRHRYPTSTSLIEVCYVMVDDCSMWYRPVQSGGGPPPGCNDCAQSVDLRRIGLDLKEIVADKFL